MRSNNRIKTLISALLILFLLFSGLFGISLLKKTIDLICKSRNISYSANEENAIYANQLNNCGLLCNCINYKCYAIADNELVIYNDNQYMIYSLLYSRPILYNYCSMPSVSRISYENCKKIAVKYTRALIPLECQKGTLYVKSAEKFKGIYSYRFSFSDNTERSVEISVRSDTGKIVYFDSSQCYG